MPRKTDKLTIRIDPVVKKALREVAEAEHRSISNMVEVMILERHEQKNINPAEPSGKQHRKIRVPSRSKKGAAE
jgi:hypothetical protein